LWLLLPVQVKRYEGEAEKRLLDTPDENKYVFAQVLDDCGQVRAANIILLLQERSHAFCGQFTRRIGSGKSMLSLRKCCMTAGR
jgi:hypothetical protein